jgi:hypothetical protein
LSTSAVRPHFRAGAASGHREPLTVQTASKMMPTSCPQRPTRARAIDGQTCLGMRTQLGVQNGLRREMVQNRDVLCVQVTAAIREA